MLNYMQGQITGTVAPNNAVAYYADGRYGFFSLSVFGTFVGGIFLFEYSLDSTDGVDGTWNAASAVRSAGSVGNEDRTTTLTTNPGYGWLITAPGCSWFRVRASSFASGVANWNIKAEQNDFSMSPFATGAAAAHDAVVSGNPVRIAGKSASSTATAVSAANDTVDLQATLKGALVVSPYCNDGVRRRGSSALTTTSDVAVIAAPGSGLVTCITSIQAINTGASAVDLILKDNTTEFWRMTLPQNVPFDCEFPCPIQLAVNVVLNAALSAAGTVRLNVQGYTI